MGDEINWRKRPIYWEDHHGKFIVWLGGQPHNYVICDSVDEGRRTVIARVFREIADALDANSCNWAEQFLFSDAERNVFTDIGELLNPYVPPTRYDFSSYKPGDKVVATRDFYSYGKILNVGSEDIVESVSSDHHGGLELNLVKNGRGWSNHVWRKPQ